MSDDDRVPYTPRRHLEGVLTNIEDRRSAVRSILSTERKAPSGTTQYLRGYYDALELVTAELRDAKDSEIMGITPGDDDE